ncbi:hypothetical protein C2857_003530 [Epichloe festucae Fl1]|uniref:Uncharacterized protein n=1 Tax=Epichloe festucae (strain Fl1) TaxID=877507 RepID=A0A7S9PTW6_EPIFF|nr:hypothetical protein C2857_003530 [Epichloe festucae Fl1]
MKFGISQVVICLMATAAPTVQAFECTKGLKYCGWNLRHLGWDEIELIRALQRQGKRPTVGNIQYSLYECVSRGKIEWNRKCGDFNCGNGGGGKSDFCT